MIISWKPPNRHTQLNLFRMRGVTVHFLGVGGQCVAFFLLPVWPGSRALFSLCYLWQKKKKKKKKDMPRFTQKNTKYFQSLIQSRWLTGPCLLKNFLSWRKLWTRWMSTRDLTTAYDRRSSTPGKNLWYYIILHEGVKQWQATFTSKRYMSNLVFGGEKEANVERIQDLFEVPYSCRGLTCWNRSICTI